MFGTGQSELADDPAVAADREEQGGIARVVVDPEDTGVPPALDNARRLGNRLVIEPAHHFERNRLSASRSEDQRLSSRVIMGTTNSRAGPELPTSS